MRWRSVSQGFDQKSELAHRLLAREAEKLEDPELQLRIMDTNRSAPQLFAVEDHVIGECTCLERLPIEQCKIIGMRRSERMVNRDHALFCLVVFEQRKLDYPQELEFARLAHPEPAAELKPQVAQDRADARRIARHHQQRITGL